MEKIRKLIRAILKEKFSTILFEEFQISQKFIKNEFEKNGNNAIILEVGIDEGNDIQHTLNLILSFGNPSGYEELVFYFNIVNKDRTKITSNPKSIYDREIAKKYLPKELIEKYIFKNKINKMLKMLLNMKKPTKFFLETYEDYKDAKQIDYYLDLVNLILDNGYVINKQGVNNITKK